ncbi:hypothetical protein RI367_000292 [Sorochytrium milnesiophthora]
MARPERQTILVSVVEGCPLYCRNFPKLPASTSLSVVCRFNGEVLDTDPVPAQSAPIWDTELAWDLDAKVLHFLRSQRASIKLDCFANHPKGRKELVGYLVLDLRSAQEFPLREAWATLINPKSSVAIKPELKFAFGIGPHDAAATATTPVPHTRRAASPTRPVSAPPVRSQIPMRRGPARGIERVRDIEKPQEIHPECIDSAYYKIGKGNARFTLSVMVSGAQQLDTLALPSVEGQGFTLDQPQQGYYLYFSFLGENVVSTSCPTLVSCQDVSFSRQFALESSLADLRRYLRQLAKLVVYLCHDNQILGFTDVDFVEAFDPSSGRPCFLSKDYALISTKNDPNGLTESAARVNVSINIAEGFAAQQVPSPAPEGQFAATPEPHTTAVDRTPSPKPRSPAAVGVAVQQELHQDTPVMSAAAANGQKWHQYRFSIDIRSIKALQLSAANVYFRHAYPAFGTASPFISQTPTQVFRGAESTVLPHTFCAYEFVMSADRLRTFLDAVPLLIDVWHRDTHARDTQIGVATVRMNQVYSTPETMHPNGTCKIRLFDHFVVVTSQENDMWVKVAEVRVVLALEDFGELEEQDDGGNPALNGIDRLQIPESVPETTPLDAKAADDPAGEAPLLAAAEAEPPLLGSHKADVTSVAPAPQHSKSERSSTIDIHSTPEYKTALELELWKKSEEEKFNQLLRKKEQAVMARLTDEMRRREHDREVILRQKIADFQTLESQLETLVKDLEQRETKLIRGEEDLFQRRIELERDYERRASEQQMAMQQLDTEFQRLTAAEHQRTNDTEHMLTVATRERDAALERLARLEQENAQLKQAQASSPEVALRAEVNSLTAQVNRLTRDLDSAKRAKAHYKAQWVKVVAEFAHHKKQVQMDREESLRRQQLDLDDLKASLKQHDQPAIVEDVAHLKEQLQQLRAQSSLEKLQRATAPSPKQLQPYAEVMPPPFAPQPHPKIAPEIDRLTRERDLLLKTGVYTAEDRIVVELNAKIQQLMAG